jgi:hypothetical protein
MTWFSCTEWKAQDHPDRQALYTPGITYLTNQHRLAARSGKILLSLSLFCVHLFLRFHCFPYGLGSARRIVAIASSNLSISLLVFIGQFPQKMFVLSPLGFWFSANDTIRKEINKILPFFSSLQLPLHKIGA